MDPQQQSPTDYLDQISTQPSKPGMSNRLFFMIIGGVLGLAIIVVVLMLVSNGQSKGITPEQLGLRLQSLQKISSDAQKNIKDSELRAINSRLTTQLAGTNRDITEPLKAAKIDLKKVSKSVAGKETEYSDELGVRLEDARLNDEFDSTYSREMAYEMDNVTIMMKAVRKKSKSKSLNSFLDSSYTNLTSLQKELANYAPS